MLGSAIKYTYVHAANKHFSGRSTVVDFSFFIANF